MGYRAHVVKAGNVGEYADGEWFNSVVSAPLGRYVDRTLDKVFPKTGDDKQKQHR